MPVEIRLLPVATGAATAGAAAESAAEVSTTATTISAATAAKSAASAAAHHAAEQEPEPAATTTAAAEHEQDEDDEKDDAEPVGVVLPGLVVVDGSGLLGRGEGDVGVGGDDGGELLDAGLDGRAVLALLELGVHAAANVADLGVGEDALKAVANLDAVLVILNGEDHEDALVGGLGADLPSVFERGGKGIYVLAVEGFDGDDFDGGVGARVDLPGETFDVFFGGRVDDVGEVADVAGGLGELVGRLCGRVGREGEEEKKREGSSNNCHTMILRRAERLVPSVFCFWRDDDDLEDCTAGC